MIVFLPIDLSAQDEGKNPIPLDHFYAQPRHGSNAIRKALKDFHFEFSLGYGSTYFNDQLAGKFGLFQPQPKGKRLYDPRLFYDVPTNRYTNFLNNVSGDTILNSSFLVRADTSKTKIGFKGKAWNIPFKASVFYQYKQFRFGGGYSYEYMSIGTMHPISYANKIRDYHPQNSTGMVRKYWIKAGYEFYRWNEYIFAGDMEVGNWKPKNFNTSIAIPSTYINLGITVERSLSEYLRVFARPSYEIKSYNLAIASTNHSIHYQTNAFYFNIGFSYSIPELPRCFLADCHAQINHAHGNKEYRSNRHPVYKKQNPGYGENNPTLIKYKGKNKKKLNPY